MAAELTAERFSEEFASLPPHSDSAAVRKYYRELAAVGEGRVVAGVRMGAVFALAKDFVDMELDQIEVLLESPVHEMRVGALSIMGKQASKKKTTETRRKELYELYLRRMDRIDNWDLVDVSAHHVVGRYLEDKPRDVLYELVRSSYIWERRLAMVSCLHLIRAGAVDDTFALARLLVRDEEEPVQKAVGWMLREAGNVDPGSLRAFLDEHAATMSRVALRTAVEKFDADERKDYRSR